MTRQAARYNGGHHNDRDHQSRVLLPEDGLLHQRYKDIVFWGIAKATVPNYLLRRYVMSSSAANRACHLHLGCGTRYLPGFLNIDGNPFHKIDLWLDVRNGLTFRSNS